MRNRMPYIYTLLVSVALMAFLATAVLVSPVKARDYWQMAPQVHITKDRPLSWPKCIDPTEIRPTEKVYGGDTHAH